MPLSAGKRLGPYEIVSPLGSGGMGEVYRAHDDRLQRDVALKVLPAAGCDAVGRKRLLQEARTASALNHPHICTIFEVGEAEGQLYIAMELVDGRPLAAIIDAGLPADTVVRYGIQIADGLAHAHTHGVVHCDLKSPNVMITAEGRAKILDFGLATRQVAPDDATQSAALDNSSIRGTLAYMAPEMLRGDAADARSDIWALGVMLYEMSTGRRPYKGNSVFDLTSAILKEPLPTLPESVPAGLQAVIQRCLQKDATQRYQTAAEARACLESMSHPSAVVATRPRSRMLMGIGAAAMFVVLAAGAFFLMRPQPQARIESLAVLPLDNFSHDPEQDYFADGMTEQLTADLSKISALRVISRTSVMGYKGSHKSVAEIARELHVDAIVEGSVMRDGNRVRITAQLIQAPADKHLWADTYDRDLRDILTLQSEVARTIADQVRITLTPQEQARLGKRRQVDPEVFQLYLRGQYAADQASPDEQEKGIAYFEQAIAKDPTYAPAYAGLALVYGGMASIKLAPHDAMPKARTAALKAIELDESLSEAHTALAKVKMLYDWDWDGAEKELRRAIQLNPSSAEAHHTFGVYYGALNQGDQAVQELTKAQILDPLSLNIASDFLVGAIFARQYDVAISESKKLLARNPNFAFAHAWLGMAYMEKQQYPEAVAELRAAQKLQPGYTMDHFLAVVLAAAGDKAEARQLAVKLEQTADSGYVCAYEVAEVHAALGDKDKAYKWLDRGLREQCDCLALGLKNEPWMDPLRVDPRYAMVVKRVFGNH